MKRFIKSIYDFFMGKRCDLCLNVSEKLIAKYINGDMKFICSNCLEKKNAK